MILHGIKGLLLKVDGGPLLSQQFLLRQFAGSFDGASAESFNFNEIFNVWTDAYDNKRLLKPIFSVL